MSNVINFPGAEAPMDEWAEPIREPITITVRLPDLPPPPATPASVMAAQIVFGALMGVLFVCALI